MPNAKERIAAEWAMNRILPNSLVFGHGVISEERAAEAIGITGFTLPTMYRWVTSEAGRAASLHPYRNGHYLGSGQGVQVLTEAGLDGESQARYQGLRG